MEKMNELLDKYFRGETSLAEEEILKSYFLSEAVKSEHESYRVLFEVFDQEKKETANAPLLKVLPRQREIKHFWIKTFSYSGIAAALVLALWVQYPRSEKDYAIIHGHRINDPEYAQKYAEKKLNDVNEMLQNGLRPLRNMEALKENLRASTRKNGTLKDEIIELNKTRNINN
jgi:hypothetical protein